MILQKASFLLVFVILTNLIKIRSPQRSKSFIQPIKIVLPKSSLWNIQMQSVEISNNFLLKVTIQISKINKMAVWCITSRSLNINNQYYIIWEKVCACVICLQVLISTRMGNTTDGKIHSLSSKISTGKCTISNPKLFWYAV